MELPSERILNNYDIYLDLLKFALKHDSNPEYKDLSLVDTYNQLLKNIEKAINEVFNEKVREENSLEMDEILFSFFKDEDQNYDRQVINNKVQDFKKFINTEEKRELIRKFELIMILTDIASDRAYDDEEVGGLWRLEEVDKELNKITTCFHPILKKIEKRNK